MTRTSTLLSGLVVWLASGGLLCGADQPDDGQRKTTELLPPSVIALAEVPNLDRVLSTVIEHPLRDRLLNLPAYQVVMQSPDLNQFKLVIAAFEGTIKKPWREAIATLSDGGITVAVDSANGGAALLMKSSDEEALRNFQNFILAIRQSQNGDAAPTQGQYRGFNAYRVSQNLRMALIGQWLVLTNNAELGKSIIDRYVDQGDSLETNERYQAIRTKIAAASKQPAASGFLDLTEVRRLQLAKEVFNERVDNFLGELVLGGVLANVRHTEYAMLNLNVETSGLQLQWTTPHDPAWESPREYYFGAPERAVAPPLLNTKDRLFAISAHRDISQMWLRAGDLLSDRANDELAKADSQLATLFSGRDFGEDILGSLESDVQMVGKAQDFTDQLPKPAIKLPSFAIQFRMKDPAETQPELRRIFQSFVGFLNVVGAMNGQPQLDLGMETAGDAQLVTATYIAERDARESVPAPINFNFSPTIAFASERVILSSTTELARELAAMNDESAQPEPLNTEVLVEAKTLQRILQDNKDQLVANNMLEEGHDKTAAEGEIGLLLELVSFLDRSRLSLEVADNEMQLTVDLSLDSGQAK